MGTKERRERERIETRDKILDAARELFITKGYDGVSMRQIAEKIEYTPTAIYGHFEDKESLFLELCHEDFHRLAVQFAGLAKVTDPVERVRKAGYAYLDFGIRNPNHYRMMFMTSHPAMKDEHDERFGKGNPEEDSYEFLKLTVAEALRTGAFREGLTDPNLIAQTLWAGLHGVISLQIAKSADHWVPWVSIKKRGETMIDALLTGILRPTRN